MNLSNKVKQIWVLLFFIIFTACHSDTPNVDNVENEAEDTPSKTLTSIQITPARINIALENDQQLTAVGIYDDGSREDISSRVNWVTNAPQILTIDSQAILRASQAVETTLNASLDNISSNTAAVIVSDTSLVDIQITPPVIRKSQYNSEQLQAIGVYEDGSKTDITRFVNWTSTDSATATAASKRNKASPLDDQLIVQASRNGIVSNTTSFFVTNSTLERIQITPALTNMPINTSTQFTAIGIFSNGGSEEVTDSVVWASSNDTTLTIDQLGRAGALATGDVQITATLGGISSQPVSLSVTAAQLATIQVTPSAVDLTIGHNNKLTAIGYYDDNTHFDLTNDVTWSSDNTDVATVELDGTATGIVSGATTVTANLGNIISNNVAVEVKDVALAAIQITPARSTINTGYAQQLTAIGLYSDNTTVDITHLVTWSSDNIDITTVDLNGSAMGIFAGTAKIKASINDIVSNEVELSVTDATLTNIQITPAENTLAINSHLALTAIGQFSDGTSKDLTSFVSWTSSENALLTILPTGVSHAIAQGVATIQAEHDGVLSNISTLTITNPTLNALQLTPAITSMVKGHKQQLTVTGDFSDNTSFELNNTVTWISSDPSIITVSPQGEIEAIELGSATVTAVYKGISSNVVAVTVNDPVLSSLQLSPNSTNLLAGNTLQMSTTANYSDGSSNQLNELVNWVSSDTSVATVSLQGIVTAVSAGTATITTHHNGIFSNQASINITSATLSSIEISPASNNLIKGNSQQLSALASYSDGESLDLTNTVSWISSNTNIATVDSQGLVTAVDVGSVTISANHQGVTSNTSVITITNPALNTILISPESASIIKGNSQQLSALASYSDGESLDLTNTVSWISSNTNIATVNSQGLVTAVDVGSVTISANHQGVTSNTSVITITNPALNTILISPESASIIKGNSQQLSALASYSDGESLDLTNTVSWISSNTNIATVDSQGLVTAVDVGSVTISANHQGVTSNTAVITITNPALNTILISPESASIIKGNSQQLSALASYSDGESLDLTNTVSWISSNTNIATVNSQGLVTAVDVGSVTISANHQGVTSNTSVITITNPALNTILISPESASIIKGNSQQLSALASYSDGESLDLTNTVSWISSNTNVAVVSASGLLTAVNPGSANISVSHDGITSNIAAITVTNAELTGLQLTPATASIAHGNTLQLSASGSYSDASTADLTSTVPWISSNTNVAVVSASGLLTAVNPGIANISVSHDGITSNIAAITVTNAELTGLQLTPATASIAHGNTLQLSASGSYSDASTADLTSAVSWISSNTNVAVVSASGLLTAVNPGIANISVSHDGITSNIAAITVTNAELTGLQLTPATASIAHGNTLQLSASGSYSDASTADVTSAVSWISSNTNVAVVSASGLLTAVNPGSANISVSHDGITSNIAAITVTNAELTGLQLTPATASIAHGNTLQLSASGSYSDASTADLTSTVSWISSNTNVAVVSASGLLTAVNPGSANISVSHDGITSNIAAITVTNAELTGLQLTPATASIAHGNTLQLSASGSYSDASTADLTSTVSWISSNTNVAVVSASGLLTAVNPGSANISVSHDGITSNIAAITVTNAELTGLQLTPATASIAHGNTLQLSASGSYSDASTADLTSTVPWISSNTNVAVVSASGLLTAVNPGSANISVSHDGITSNIAAITVTNAELTGLQLTPATASIAHGNTLQLSASGSYSDASTDDLTSAVSWISSNTSIATVSAQGLVSSLSLGSANISASLNGVTSDTAVITVSSAQLVSIAITPESTDVQNGNTQQMVANGTYTNGSSVLITDSVTWTSSDTNVATISAQGILTTVNAGTVTITAEQDGITSQVATVTVTPALLTSILLTPLDIDVQSGASQQLTAIGTYSNGSEIDITTEVNWSWTVFEKATISADGLMTATNLGNDTVRITAEKDGITSNVAKMRVKAPILLSIAMNSFASTLSQGESQTVSAIGSYSYGDDTDITLRATWTSSDPSVATVSSDGVIEAIAQGTTIISATLDGVFINNQLTVGPAALASFDLSPASLLLTNGSNQAISFTGTYTDGSVVDFTNLATWSSNDPAVVTVVNGLATAVEVGSTTITVSHESINEVIDVTVTNATLTSITLNPTEISAIEGINMQLTATGLYSDSSTADISSSVIWGSDDPNTFSINGSGVGIGNKLGRTNITATKDGISQSATASVSLSYSGVKDIEVNQLPVTTENSEHIDATITAITPFSPEDEVTFNNISFEYDTVNNVWSIINASFHPVTSILVRHGTDNTLATLTLDQPLSEYSAAEINFTAVTIDKIAIENQANMFAPNMIFAGFAPTSNCGQLPVTASCYSALDSAERVIYEKYLINAHDAFNRKSFLDLIENFFIDSCLDFDECTSYSDELMGIGMYSYLHMSMEGHQLTLKAMRDYYTAEGVGGGAATDITKYITSSSGWASLWEDYIDPLSPSYKPYVANTYNTLFHEIAHAYQFNHSSGMTYGVSDEFARDYAAEKYPFETRDTRNETPIPDILMDSEILNESLTVRVNFKSVQTASVGDIDLRVMSGNPVSFTLSPGPITDNGHSIDIKFTETPDATIYVQAVHGASDYMTNIKIPAQPLTPAESLIVDGYKYTFVQDTFLDSSLRAAGIRDTLCQGFFDDKQLTTRDDLQRLWDHYSAQGLLGTLDKNKFVARDETTEDTMWLVTFGASEMTFREFLFRNTWVLGTDKDIMCIEPATAP